MNYDPTFIQAIGIIITCTFCGWMLGRALFSGIVYAFWLHNQPLTLKQLVSLRKLCDITSGLIAGMAIGNLLLRL